MMISVVLERMNVTLGRTHRESEDDDCADEERRRT